MLPFGVMYVENQVTCLTSIKDVVEELRDAELVGPRRWSSVLALPRVHRPRNGDLIVWACRELTDFVPRHVGLIVNVEECFIYHMCGQWDLSEPDVVSTKMTQILDFHKPQYVKYFRPRH